MRPDVYVRVLYGPIQGATLRSASRMSPRVLLVNPPIYDFTAYDFWLKPYGLLRVAGYMRGRADMHLFDYLDRYHPCLFEAWEPRSDAWGRGAFFATEVP